MKTLVLLRLCCKAFYSPPPDVTTSQLPKSQPIRGRVLPERGQQLFLAADTVLTPGNTREGPCGIFLDADGRNILRRMRIRRQE
ncbi:hypothetical protein BaRGS_00019624 [Batillaria attramentaria]|uniref:Uncharacterized protein n=1 Tax=Batillaria attramentaria TaxID=370345 RepID=A0ABD0KPW8_9CAEN